ncbi:MAG: hypothetical protein K5745_07980 [Saccharofermentans sp.]|nr:hypothetical protein [Saccharofermentans sp.]
MFYNDHRLTIVIGAYGSGKSEIAVNISMKQREADKSAKLLIADMDIVNPFYRSSDCAPVLEENNIKLISPMYAGSNVDAPVLPAEMYMIFDDESYKGVFDIGGEDMGAIVLGSLKHRILNTDHTILMAVNTLRPFTQTEDQIIQMTGELIAASGFQVDGYINNTNLLEQTTGEMVREGEEIMLRVSEKTGIPLVATCVMEGIDAQDLKAPEVFTMRRLIKYNY